ncbi:proline-rich proteoglycan 2-like [Sorex fumeus]|uniref:proline-rich proteoglycan 2-like n=1 Tax=Sorex fumeus TaxID=62283 RepID=UPI0024AC8BF5|nr:proline-rich proteoglycan 2-like [Sorex fumeus]
MMLYPCEDENKDSMGWETRAGKCRASAQHVRPSALRPPRPRTPPPSNPSSPGPALLPFNSASALARRSRTLPPAPGPHSAPPAPRGAPESGHVPSVPGEAAWGRSGPDRGTGRRLPPPPPHGPLSRRLLRVLSVAASSRSPQPPPPQGPLSRLLLTVPSAAASSGSPQSPPPQGPLSRRLLRVPSVAASSGSPQPPPPQGPVSRRLLRVPSAAASSGSPQPPPPQRRVAACLAPSAGPGAPQRGGGAVGGRHMGT